MADSLTDKIMDTESFDSIRRFTMGALSALAIPFGMPALLAAGVTSAALDVWASKAENKNHKQDLLNFYRDEIATIQNKPPVALTLEDLDEVTRPKSEGGKGIKTLRKETEDYDLHHRFQKGFGIVSSAIMTGVLVGLSALFPGFLEGGMALVLGLGLAGLGQNVISQGVKSVGRMIYGGHDHKIENGVHQRLMRIAEEIKEHPVKATDIFDLFAQSKKSLQAEILEKCGKHYHDLTIIQKKRVMEEYEPQVRAIALTAEMNEGRIKPSLAGFIITGNCGENQPGHREYQALKEKAVVLPAPEAEKEPQFAQRLDKEREQPASRHLH